LDEVGLDVALQIARTLAGQFGGHLKVPESLGVLAGAGLLGRKSGSGFYVYEKGTPTPSPQAAELARRQAGRAVDRRQLQDRMVFAMINEAARCLDEQVASGPEDVDFAMVSGAGFAPFRGGPLRHADMIGAAALCEGMQRLADAGATHLAPCGKLKQMAAEARRFYPTSGP
jgi:3-hydroxyacyl-CoA dehydrogenase/enoyl-CoA hydratase/3-hydroxybutyryl-CoA epimerase